MLVNQISRGLPASAQRAAGAVDHLAARGFQVDSTGLPPTSAGAETSPTARVTGNGASRDTSSAREQDDVLRAASYLLGRISELRTRHAAESTSERDREVYAREFKALRAQLDTLHDNSPDTGTGSRLVDPGAERRETQTPFLIAAAIEAVVTRHTDNRVTLRETAVMARLSRHRDTDAIRDKERARQSSERVSEEMLQESAATLAAQANITQDLALALLA